MLYAAFLAVDHLLWSIYGLYFAAIDPSPGRSGWLGPPSSMNTPCPGMKLTLACRLGAEISPNRCDKNLIPWAAMDRVVREQPWGHDVRCFYHPLGAIRERHAESRIAAHLLAHTACVAY